MVDYWSVPSEEIVLCLDFSSPNTIELLSVWHHFAV